MLIEIIIGIVAFLLIFCFGFRLGVSYIKDDLSDYDTYPQLYDLSEPELYRN